MREGMTSLEMRRKAAQALAKAIAYKDCGCQRKAEAWAVRLLYILDTMDVLHQERIGPALDMTEEN